MKNIFLERKKKENWGGKFTKFRKKLNSKCIAKERVTHLKYLSMLKCL